MPRATLTPQAGICAAHVPPNCNVPKLAPMSGLLLNSVSDFFIVPGCVSLP